MYASGRGATKDYAVALDWYRKSAAQGNHNAEAHLGIMYENGWGVKGDIVEAKQWYQKAASQGDHYAKQALERLNGATR